VVGKQADLVIKHHESTWNEEMLLIMERHGYTEETYFTWSYSPIGAGDSASGLFCAVTEDTSKVIGRRRLRTIRELAIETANLRSSTEIFAAATNVLDRNPYDIPFALVYEVDAEADRAVLAGTVRLQKTSHRSVTEVGLDSEANPWNLNLRSDEIRLISGLDK